MTFKHYQALADALLAVRPYDKGVTYIHWVRTVQAIADVCTEFNGMFDRGRFEYAAGVR